MVKSLYFTREKTWFEEKIGTESRVSILGYIQRGGNPSVQDRLMAHQFVTNAIDALLAGKSESVICYEKNGFHLKGIEEVTSQKKELDKKLLSFI